MDEKTFNSWLDAVTKTFTSEVSDQQRCVVLDRLISNCGGVQLRHLSTKLEDLVKRDFLRLLPTELGHYLLSWLDAESLCQCCLVNRHWNKMVNECAQAWQRACRLLGMNIVEQENLPEQNGVEWKTVYRRTRLRLRQMKEGLAFDSATLHGHSARVYALHYREGKLASGSDDLTVRLWDVRTGQCQRVLQTHTVADIKFDSSKVLTASFDNTVACWDWNTGERKQQFVGHTGAVFSVEYVDELDLLISGSADTTVKIWQLSSGNLINTLHGHTDWVTQVLIQPCRVDSDTFSKGDQVLLSMDKSEIRVWCVWPEVNTSSMKTLTYPTSIPRGQSFLPRLQFDGACVVCASDIGILVWNFKTYDLLRLIPHTDYTNLVLLGYGTTFMLFLDQKSLNILNTQTHESISSWRLPTYRRSKRGSNFVAGSIEWLDGFGLDEEEGLVFATSMPDYSLHLVRWRGVPIKR
ncbi:F-box/WD repeat-containing protein 2-like [Amphiura filiformis]|uniref:F-box/WD repeat-containing protein 2-like n=1 Tax=Amphiura filiformis TaxID=82378 RepID=UPI003B2233BC